MEGAIVLFDSGELDLLSKPFAKVSDGVILADTSGWSDCLFGAGTTDEVDSVSKAEAESQGPEFWEQLKEALEEAYSAHTERQDEECAVN